MIDLPAILCVEDNPQNLMLVRKVLAEAGFRVVCATDGPSAVELAAREKPRVVLLDIHLPGFDGFEVLRRIREIEGLEKVRVVALTADVLRDDRARILEAGFDDYVSKPFRIDTLVGRVRALAGS